VLGPSHHAYTLRHHSAQTTLVASTERPAISTSTPLLDALKAEKWPQRDKEAIQRNSSSLQGRCSSIQEGQFQEDGRAGLRCYIRGEAGRRFDRTAWQTSREEGRSRRCGHREGFRSACLHEAAENPKVFRCFTNSKPSPSSPSKGQVLARQQASTIHVTRASHIDGPFIFESPHRLWYLDYVRTCTFSCTYEP